MIDKFTVLRKNFMQLSEEEMANLLSLISLDKLIKPLNNKKKYPKLNLYKIHSANNTLITKLPQIYCEEIKKGNGELRNIILNELKLKTNEIENLLCSKNYYYSWKEDKLKGLDDNDFLDLIIALGEVINHESILIFLNLFELKLLVKQRKVIEDSKIIFNLKSQMKMGIQQELEKQFEVHLIRQQEKHDQLLQKQNAKYQKLENKLSDITEKYKTEKSSIEEINNAKSSTEAKMRSVESKNTKLENQLSNLRIQFENQKVKYDQVEEKRKRLSEQLGKKSEEYYKQLDEVWISKNSELTEELEMLTEEVIELKTIKNNFIDEMKELEYKKRELVGTLQRYEEKVNDYIINLDLKLIESKLNQHLLQVTTQQNSITNHNTHTNSLYITEGYKESDVEVCENIDDFVETLMDNLETIGVSEQISDEISVYVSGVLASGLIPLICGYRSRDIAKALAAAYSGELPTIITLPTAFSNTQELLEQYNNAKTQTVIVEDVLGGASESSLLPLIREHNLKKKLLIFTSEDTVAINFIPNMLLNYTAVVKVDVETTSYNEELIYLNSKETINDFSLSTNITKNKDVKYLIKDLRLTNDYAMLRTKILGYIEECSDLDKETTIKRYVESELLMLKQDMDFKEQLRDNIKKKFSGNLYTFISEVC